MDKKITDIPFMNNKEVGTMPTTELVEHERVAYVQELKEYLNNLKKMSNSEARIRSHSNLVDCKIIQEDGEFTEQYKYSKKHTMYKE